MASSSSISGNAGVANSGALVSCFRLDGRISSGVIGAVAPGAATLVTSAVVAANGSWSISGLSAGTYLLVAAKGPAVNGQPGILVEPSTNIATVAVDGSSSYSI